MLEVRAALVESGHAADEVAEAAAAVKHTVVSSRVALAQVRAGTSRTEPAACLAALDRAVQAVNGLVRQAQAVKVHGDHYQSSI